MGYMRHHAIVVTTYREAEAEKAKALASALFEQEPSPLLLSPTNGYFTFLIPPDGSKEGWDTSARGDDARERFVEWLQDQTHEDGSSWFDWAEVRYGDDNGHAAIIRHSDSGEQA